jgi:hypothetical protein
MDSEACRGEFMGNKKIDVKTPSWGFSGYITVLPPEPSVELTDNPLEDKQKQAKCDEEGLSGPSR